MNREFCITPPFFEIGPKAYLYGRDALDLARWADAASTRYGVDIILTPQATDIYLLAKEVKTIRIFAQHMDPLEIGRGVGSILPEAVKAAGASGVLLNHVEKRLSHEVIDRSIRRADEVGLASMVCADTIEDAVEIARMQPNIVLVESPALIGLGARDVAARQEISRINQVIWKINPAIRVLHGAGIQSSQDVYDVIAAGAQATGSTSGILLSKNPKTMLDEMIHATRSAWDDTH
jgi:triosephosphate isomerase